MNLGIQKWTVDQIEVLVFEIMGTRFAVDLDQVDEMLEIHQAEKLDPVRLDDLIEFPERRVVYQDPRILMIPGGDGMTPLMIDQPLDITQVNLESIKRFPSLLELCRTVDSIWGVAMIHEYPVLLLDCQKLTLGREAGSVTGD